MNLPTRYAYNLKLWMLTLGFAAGLGYPLLIMFFEGSRWPHGFPLWLGICLLSLTLFLAVRRFFFDIFILLEENALVVPTGLGRIRTARVPYASIVRVWETRLPFTVVYSLATKEGKKYEIVSTMLPNAHSYIEIGRFLHAQTLKLRQ